MNHPSLIESLSNCNKHCIHTQQAKSVENEIKSLVFTKSVPYRILNKPVIKMQKSVNKMQKAAFCLFSKQKINPKKQCQFKNSSQKHNCTTRLSYKSFYNRIKHFVKQENSFKFVSIRPKALLYFNNNSRLKYRHLYVD